MARTLFYICYVCVYIYTCITNIALHYITYHYITYHYITLHYIPLHYITLNYITLNYITYIHTYTHVASSCFCFSSRSPWSTKRISFQLKRLDTWHMLGVHLPAQKRRRYMPCLWLSRHHLLLCVLDLCSKQSAGQVTTALHRVVPMHVHFHWMHPASLCFHFFILFHRCGHSRHWPTYWDIGRWAEASSKARST